MSHILIVSKLQEKAHLNTQKLVKYYYFFEKILENFENKELKKIKGKNPKYEVKKS